MAPYHSIFLNANSRNCKTCDYGKCPSGQQFARMGEVVLARGGSGARADAKPQPMIPMLVHVV